jgi:nucleoside-diphosphate-sugar epimerase
MARIAITGGSGSVGRAVVTQALAMGHQLVNVDRADASPGVTHVQADLADYDALVAAFQGCEALIHLAAIPVPFKDPDHVVHNNNVTGSYNALRAAVAVGIRRIAQASSVNAIGHAFSRAPRYDYFPLDEAHPSYAEDAYSLSKWICEVQAEAMARLVPGLSIASLRFHWNRPRDVARAAYAAGHLPIEKHLWAYVDPHAAAQACLAAIGTDLGGHQVFFIAAPDTTEDDASRDLAARQFPQVPIRGAFAGNSSFFDTSKARRMLGWTHAPSPTGMTR